MLVARSPTSSSTSRAGGTQLPRLQKKLSGLSSPLPIQNKRGKGAFQDLPCNVTTKESSLGGSPGGASTQAKRSIFIPAWNRSSRKGTWSQRSLKNETETQSILLLGPLLALTNHHPNRSKTNTLEALAVKTAGFPPSRSQQTQSGDSFYAPQFADKKLDSKTSCAPGSLQRGSELTPPTTTHPHPRLGMKDTAPSTAPKPPTAGADPQHSPLQRGDLQDPASSLRPAQ